MRYNKLVTAMIATGLYVGGAHAFDMDLGEVVERDEEKWAELTEVRSEVNVGLIHVDKDAYRFGHYTGLDSSGAYLLLDADIRHRDAYDGDTAGYWALRAKNLGLDSRQLEAEYGSQGSYRIYLDYSEIPTRKFNDGRSPYLVTDGNLTLPATGNPATLEDHLRALEIGLNRKHMDLGGEYRLSPSLSLRTDFSQKKREGLSSVGLGRHWISGQSIIAPLPVDETTNQIDLAMAWRGELSRAEIGYRTSQYSNEHSSLRWNDALSSDWNSMGGEKARAPDNEHHEVYVSGNHRLGEQTHLSASAAMGRSTQDVDFVGTTMMSRGSLKAEVDTSNLALKLTSRPMEKLRLNVGYQMDKRDNNTGQIVRNNVDVIDPSSSYSRQRFDLGGSYRLARTTRLNIDYRYTDTERDPAHSDSSEENSLKARLRTHVGATSSIGLTVGKENRKGSTYVRDSGPADLKNYAWADRERTRLGLFAQFMPTDILSIGFSTDLISDEYNESVLGLKESERHLSSLDGNLALSKQSSVHGFVSYETSDSKQVATDWTGDRKEQALAFGLGAKTRVLQERVELSGDFSWIESLSELGMVNAADMPDLTTRVKRFDLHAGYQLNKAMALRLRYRLEDYFSDDWATTGNIVTASGDVVTLGQQDARYRAQSVGLSLAYRF